MYSKMGAMAETAKGTNMIVKLVERLKCVPSASSFFLAITHLALPRNFKNRLSLLGAEK
jgi:hypothetical protein